MHKLVRHFLATHQIRIADAAAARLAQTVRAMTRVDAWLRLGVTGFDVLAHVPRRADVTLGELRRVLKGRKGKRRVA